MNKTKKPVDPNKEFPTVEKMLYKLAWKASECYRIPFEEARSEAYYAFMKVCESFDADRGAKFSSWCHFKVWNHFKTYMIRKSKDRLVFVELKEDLLGPAPAAKTIRDIIEKMRDMGISRDAQQMVELLLETPKELLVDKPQKTSQVVSRVKQHLGFERGLDEVYNDITLLELKSYFEQHAA